VGNSSALGTGALTFADGTTLQAAAKPFPYIEWYNGGAKSPSRNAPETQFDMRFWYRATEKQHHVQLIGSVTMADPPGHSRCASYGRYLRRTPPPPPPKPPAPCLFRRNRRRQGRQSPCCPRRFNGIKHLARSMPANGFEAQDVVPPRCGCWVVRMAIFVAAIGFGAKHTRSRARYALQSLNRGRAVRLLHDLLLRTAHPSP
jgi:hypothetical protein